MGYDFSAPFINENEFDEYIAIDKKMAIRYGKIVKAKVFSNIDYKTRFNKLQDKYNMKPPPSCGRIFSGYLVVRNLGSSEQYETWMPDHVFEEIYSKDGIYASDSTRIV